MFLSSKFLQYEVRFSVLHTGMEDTGDGQDPKGQQPEAMEAAAPLGPGKGGARDVRENPESSKGLAQEAGGELDKGSVHSSTSTRQCRVKMDLSAVFVLVTATLMFPLLGCFLNGLGSADAFPVYDCSNRSSTVTAYSLIKPDTCRVTTTGLREEKILSAEIVQIRRSQTIPVYRCHAVESMFTQYCGHSSAAGVLRILKFRENQRIEAADCCNAFVNKGNITVGEMTFAATIGATSLHQFFTAGGLDVGNNCHQGDVKLTKDITLYKQAAQRVLEITLVQESGKARNSIDNLHV